MHHYRHMAHGAGISTGKNRVAANGARPRTPLISGHGGNDDGGSNSSSSCSGPLEIGPQVGADRAVVDALIITFGEA